MKKSNSTPPYAPSERKKMTPQTPAKRTAPGTKTSPKQPRQMPKRGK